MKFPLRALVLALGSVSLLAAVSARANPVQVQEVGVGPNKTVWIDSSSLGNNLHVYACIVDLKVNGVSMEGFCIDPWHWSSGSTLTYQEVALKDAPKSANNSSTDITMGAAAADRIEELWAHYFSAAEKDDVTAAAMQILIWEIVSGAVHNGSYGTFSLLSVDNDPNDYVGKKITEMNGYLDGPGYKTKANLIGVTGAGQDYVIPNIPDTGATVALLGLGFLAVGAVRKKFAHR